MKKLLSLFLVLTMLVSALCVTMPIARAASTDETSFPEPSVPDLPPIIPEINTEPTPTEIPTIPETPTQQTDPTVGPTDPSVAPTDPSVTPTDPSVTPTDPSVAPTDPSIAPIDPPTNPTQPTQTTPTQPYYPPATQPTQSYNPQPTTSTNTWGAPTISKHPTSETVLEGGTCEFVAKADNWTEVIWYLVSPNNTELNMERAPEKFMGLRVSGIGTEHLTMELIPVELNEYRVYAQYKNANGSTKTIAATLNVIAAENKAPTISEQPRSWTLNAGETATLHAGAVSAEPGATLTYQWYRNKTNSNTGGKAIVGATSETYTPEYLAGTTYYYCAVRSMKGNQLSVASKTECAAVTYPENGQTVVTPSAADNNVTPPSQETPSSETNPQDSNQMTYGNITAPKRSNTLLIIIVAAIIVIAILGIIATVLIMRFYPSDDEEEEEEEEAPLPPPRKRPAQKADTGFRPNFDGKPAVKPAEEEWDDLSDLGDLSIYFEDED